MEAKHTNRLAREKSPYLLQHAHNPVDWFAWNDEAFAKARSEAKPIFLSIGYSTCHWCHVMERESFEDEKVGAFLNEHFVSIKLDREERPDVDKIYMTFVQATTGSGGWPLNVFLTPDLKPFFGGTYFPPDNRHGRPSFLQVLEQIAQLWRDRKTDLTASAGELHGRLELITARDAGGNFPLTADTLKRAAAQFKGAYDPEDGGFGGAPKFPQPSIPLLLLRTAKRFGDAEATAMVLKTCVKMAAGGIHDLLGGGFARYAVDAQWLVPHFEKMLYDNAQLAQLYLEAHLVALERRTSRHSCQCKEAPTETQGKMFEPANEREGRARRSVRAGVSLAINDGAHGVTRPTRTGFVQVHETHAVPFGGSDSPDVGCDETKGKPNMTAFADTARDILDYVLRDMTHPEGGFYSAEDADSEGHEGKFYCWTQEELSSLLTPQEFAVATKYFGITRNGNFVDHSHPHPLPGQNVLSVVQPVGLNEADLLESAKKKMLAVRSERDRPHRDDKILASWNGLMLGAFARASAVLGEAEYRAAAEKNLRFIREKLWNEETKNLFHRWRDGERDNVQLLEGYAFLLDGVLQLYEATLEPGHLDFAVALAEAMLAKFYDPANGGFWQSPASAGDLILRVKDDYDGAEPSGNSVATYALLRLAAITGREDFKQAAEATLQLFAARLQQQPAAMACMLQALDFWLDEPRRVVLAGDAQSALYGELLAAAHSVYQPNKIVLSNVGLVEPFARTLTAKDEATVYLCTGNSCQPPTSEAAKVREWLR